MTTLNRDQIAGWRNYLIHDAHVPSSFHNAVLDALDMATRLLDLCEAEPVAWEFKDRQSKPDVMNYARPIPREGRVIKDLIYRPESKP